MNMQPASPANTIRPSFWQIKFAVTALPKTNPLESAAITLEPEGNLPDLIMAPFSDFRTYLKNKNKRAYYPKKNVAKNIPIKMESSPIKLLNTTFNKKKDILLLSIN